MSTRGRSRGRGYFGRGGGGSENYRYREETNNRGSHRGGAEHNSYYQEGGGGGMYGRHKEMGGGPSHRGGGGREYHSANRSEERYHNRRGGSSGGMGHDRSGYDHHSSGGGSRRSPPPSHHRRPPSPPPHPRRPDQILAKLAPDEQVALTKALVATVLRESDGRDGRGYRDDRGDMRPSRDDRGRGFRDDIGGGREYRERRPPPYSGPSNRYQGREVYREDRGRGGFSRGRGGGYRGRGAPHHEVGPHQRLSMPYRGHESAPMKRRYGDYDQSEQPYKRQRLSSEGGEADSASIAERLGSRVSRESQDKDTDDEDAEKRASPTDAAAAADDDDPDRKDKEKSDKKDGDDQKSEGKDEASPSKSTKATTGNEGGRAVRKEHNNSYYHQPPRMFVELECPHCPAQCSITLKEYLHHLNSPKHLSIMDRLASKHSFLLLAIRRQQRDQQKEMENDYLRKHPDHAEISVSRFCPTCKLNYRCLGGDVREALVAHDKTRLHRMQYNYMHPLCHVCKTKEEPAKRYKSRMVYEHHLSSICHMKVKADKMEMCPEDAEKEHMEEVNLEGFMTLDSVGEDEEAGSEHGDAAAAEGEELSKKDEGEEANDDGSFAPVGMSFVKAVRMQYCKLCFLNVKEGTVRHHCRTTLHRSRYFKAKEQLARAESDKKEEEGKSQFPRSGGRANSRHEEDEEDEEASNEKQEDKQDKDAATKKESSVDDESKAKEEKDSSEKDFEEYDDKYFMYTSPRQDDYEEDQMWDQMDKDLEDGEKGPVSRATNGDDPPRPANHSASAASDDDCQQEDQTEDTRDTKADTVEDTDGTAKDETIEDKVEKEQDDKDEENGEEEQDEEEQEETKTAVVEEEEGEEQEGEEQEGEEQEDEEQGDEEEKEEVSEKKASSPKCLRRSLRSTRRSMTAEDPPQGRGRSAAAKQKQQTEHEEQQEQEEEEEEEQQHEEERESEEEEKMEVNEEREDEETGVEEESEGEDEEKVDVDTDEDE